MSLFIAFEGIDGCGKSTQARVLAEKLKEFGKDVVLTREPGATKVGKVIREMLFTTEIDPVTEVFLFASDRSSHINEVISPSLDAGKTVITDRYLLSSVVYQGIGKDVGKDFVLNVNNPITKNFVPDLTIILDMPVDIALKRVQNANRFEKYDLQERVREGFLDEASKNPEKVKVINGNQSISRVSEDILNLVLSGGNV